MSARFESGELRRLLGLPPVQDSRTFTSVSTDTRGLEPGALFVALRGERFDGADFFGVVDDLGRQGAGRFGEEFFQRRCGDAEPDVGRVFEGFKHGALPECCRRHP